jgi:hypothetical protein
LKEERKTKEKQVMDEKERKAAFRGLVAFTKVVLRESKMGVQDGSKSISVVALEGKTA